MQLYTRLTCKKINQIDFDSLTCNHETVTYSIFKVSKHELNSEFQLFYSGVLLLYLIADFESTKPP